MERSIKQRLPNWNYKLWEFGQEIIGQPFAWGVTDCAAIARKALITMYGEDLIGPHTNTSYTTKTGATRAFNKLGSFAGIAIDAGAAEIPIKLARDGDFMVFPRSGTYDNVTTKIGGMWIVSDPIINVVIAMKFIPTSIPSDVKAFRF